MSFNEESEDGNILATSDLVFYLKLLLIFLLIIGIFFKRKWKQERQDKYIEKAKNKKKSMMVILGSGGHTSEMFTLLENLKAENFTTVHFVIAQSDTTSVPRLESLAKTTRSSNFLHEGKRAIWKFHAIPRSREVGQSFISSVPTFLNALFSSFGIVYHIRPDVIITNGPGTCVPILFGAVMLRASQKLMRGYPKIIFVESFCRVQSLSLTGKIVYYMNIAGLFSKERFFIFF